MSHCWLWCWWKLIKEYKLYLFIRQVKPVKLIYMCIRCLYSRAKLILLRWKLVKEDVNIWAFCSPLPTSMVSLASVLVLSLVADGRVIPLMYPVIRLLGWLHSILSQLNIPRSDEQMYYLHSQLLEYFQQFSVKYLSVFPLFLKILKTTRVLERY